MKYYVLTEEQRDALLKELELEKFKSPQFVTPHMTTTQVVEAIHRRFHYHVCKALDAP